MTEIEQPLAQRYFDAEVKYKIIENNLYDTIISIFGMSPHDPETWRFSDYVFDGYDHSFELTGCQLDLIPTKEQLAEAWKLGFSRCWFCYIDGREKYYCKEL